MLNNATNAVQHQIYLPSHGKGANYEESKYEKVAEEIVEIPEDIVNQPELSKEEFMKEQELHQAYYKQMNDLQMPNQQNKELECFDNLYKMGFKQFSLNLLLLQKHEWSMETVIPMLTNEEKLVERFGDNWRNIK